LEPAIVNVVNGVFSGILLFHVVGGRVCSLLFMIEYHYLAYTIERVLDYH